MTSCLNLSGTLMVVGGGVTGRSVLGLLRSFDNPLIVVDDNPTVRQQCEALQPGRIRGLSVEEAGEALDGVDLVITSPGWRPDTPLFHRAEDRQVDVIGDVELAWRLDQSGAFGEPRRWLGVTGTNGKSTTTAMLAAMMRRVDPRALAVGNIGMAVTEALQSPERVNTLVVELSSFQLHWCSTLAPEAGVYLNLAEDHLDWHGGFRAYAMDKTKVLAAHKAFAGVDDENLRTLLRSEQLLDGVTGFTAGEPEPGQVGVRGGMIVDRTGAEDVELAPIEGIDPPGPAGVLDALAAAAMAYHCGVPPEDIAAALADFHVAGHRGQVVADIDGIRAIDNSKATNPHAADAALAGVENILWFAGGQLKGADVHELIAKHASRMKAAFVLGIDRQEIVDALQALAPEVRVVSTESTDPEQAMRDLVLASREIARPGDTLVLAPAAASLDMYRGMGHRGDIFTETVRSIYSRS